MPAGIGGIKNLKGKGKKNCELGYSCGASCIDRDKSCENEIPAPPKNESPGKPSPATEGDTPEGEGGKPAEGDQGGDQGQPGNENSAAGDTGDPDPKPDSGDKSDDQPKEPERVVGAISQEQMKQIDELLGKGVSPEDISKGLKLDERQKIELEQKIAREKLEARIPDLARKGMNDDQIAAALGIDVSEVKAKMDSINREERAAATREILDTANMIQYLEDFLGSAIDKANELADEAITKVEELEAIG